MDDLRATSTELLRGTVTVGDRHDVVVLAPLNEGLYERGPDEAGAPGDDDGARGVGHDRAVSALAGVVLLWVLVLAWAPLAAIRRSDVLRVAR